jgi:hypothetical protein
MNYLHLDDVSADNIEVPQNPSADEVRSWEVAARKLALYIAQGEVWEELESRLEDAAEEQGCDVMYDEDGQINILDFYTEAEIDQIARDMVDIYDNDDCRAMSWLYARSASIESGLKWTRSIGRKLPEKARGSYENWLRSLPEIPEA